MEPIKFVAFYPKTNPVLSQKFIDGHMQVLQDYGITNITSNNNTWVTNPNVYAVVAIDSNGTLVGGIRIQVADGITPLPVEKAVGHLDPTIYTVINKYAPEGVGELHALWNAKSVAGMGISLLLTRAGISIVNQTHCNILVGICADYTLKMFRKVGFVVDDTLGDGGEFVYPNENYIARVLGILNAKNMSTAEAIDRDRILSLRGNPEQTETEDGGKGPVEIIYSLKMNL